MIFTAPALKIPLLLGCLLVGASQLQAQVPVDSLFRPGKLSLVQKSLLLPIRVWQTQSYASPGQGCQFEPSCSQFMALAIAEKGPVRGVVIGTDRILRCNPSARHNHLRSNQTEILPDGRLLEPLEIPVSDSPRLEPRIPLVLSLIPGLGRISAGHTLDGILSAGLILSTSWAGYQNLEAGAYSWGGIQLTLGLTLWAADFYGAWWSAAHHPSLSRK